MLHFAFVSHRELELRPNSNRLHYACHIFLRSAATNRLITAKYHASLQINIGCVNEHCVLNGKTAISIWIRVP